jgi:hypothetical protein
MKRASLILALSTLAAAAVAKAAEDNINNYLVDIAGGAVTAVGLIDAQGAAITTIENSQDLVVALTPFASSSAGKNAFGFAITPAKTALLPMAGRTYVDSRYARLLGNLTFSYAQSRADYADQPYKKFAFAVDTVYYFDLADDPVYQSSKAFKRCADANGDARAAKFRELQDLRNDNKLTEEQFRAELAKLGDAFEADVRPCMDSALAELAKARWNSARLSLSFGEGRIRPEGGGASHSLGKAWTVNAQWPAGPKGLAQLSLRHARDALDTASLGSASLAFKSSRLAAARLTYGDRGENTDLRAMVEASSARSASAGSFKEAFVYAVGIDKKLARGTWLEFRLGRNRALVDGKEQTAALLSLNVAPTLFEFKK